jgi:transcriptional regulator with XRE-family HTH domain
MRDAHVVMTRSLRVPVERCQRLTVTVFRFNGAMKDVETFGSRVRKRRKELGLTQAALAKESGIAPGTIGDIEQGTQKGSKYIDLLATALQTSTAFLRDGTKEPQQQILAATLSVREAQLIQRFRDMSDSNKDRVESYASGIPVRKKGRKAAVSQTLQEIPTGKSRRSG